MVQWRGQNQHGSTSLAEYAVTVFLVIATLTAMTVYVQRTFQARMRDARHYMVSTVGDACDPVYCSPAANLGNYLRNVGGEPMTLTKVGDQYFAEGLTVIGNKVIQLTYKEKIGFVYDKASLKKYHAEGKMGVVIFHD